MSDLKICRICSDSEGRMHQVSGSEVQEVYEKLTKKVQEDGSLHFVCYICYCQLKKCQQLVIKLQKSEELLEQFFINAPEQNMESITLISRLSHGLQNSLMIAKIESFQIPEYSKIIKKENVDESVIDDVIVKDEPDDDGALPNTRAKLDATHSFKQEEDESIEVKQEAIFETQTYLDANEIKSSQTVCDGKSQQILVQNDIKSFICNDCGKTCDTKALLIKHISRHKPVIMKPNETHMKILKSLSEEKFKGRDRSSKNLKNSFKCQYCNYTSAQHGHLNRHIRRHTKEKPFKCQYCDHTYTRKDVLKRHIRSHTGEKPYKCKYCNYTCSQNYNLKIHIRTHHTREKPFQCQYCNYTCAKSGDLTVHVRTHTGEKPYKCQYCNYTSAQNNTLKVHIRSNHTGEKPYKCQYCKYASTVKASLKEHIRTHTGEKPYKCQYCKYASTVKASLKEHIRTHTGEKPYVCEICDNKFTSRRQLRSHLRVHMGNKTR